MNEELKDKGLKKAMKESQSYLPSNFAYHTMQKVEETVLLCERKTERRILLVTIIASLLLIVGCIIGMFICFRENLKTLLITQVTIQPECIFNYISPYYIIIIILIPLFLVFDRWMRKLYFKHHS